ncbi:uncharacterized protein LOC143184768 [Calliopsis andreniformis]|uniref:uncharacterized protein LOC143184768 n=1 Tax=Calliopsis andreniformis TaxID=337506 RepID=UPI003FCE05D2
MRVLRVILLCVALSVCQGYRILGVFPFQGKSHFIMFEHLMKGLARKGHQVDVISTFPLKKPHPNYTDLITIKTPVQFINNMTYDGMHAMVGKSVAYAVATMAGNDICEHLAHPEMQELLRNPPKDPPYDVILIEIFGAHCFAAIGHVLKVPIIGVSSSAIYPWSNDMIANPENLAIVPNLLLPFPNRMNFWQRTYNFLHTLCSKLYFNYASDEQTELVRKYVDPNMPSIRELENSVSMILVNSHMSLNGIRPTTPALVEVGGLHVHDEGIQLPASLEKWMNESTSGFIFFSFGSMVKIESFPRKYLDIFYNSLGKIAPVRVLMKIPNASELPPGLPKNIHILPWMPQVKVLKHPNIRAFITHGGLMGTQEAIHYGVPMIGIPLFADQFINIATYARHNIAIGLDVDTLTEAKMDEALRAILHDTKYRETAKKISRKFLDRPLSALDTAIYWTEYIVRHGADALRSPAMDLRWWQIELLDVLAFLLLASVLAVYLLIVILRYLYNLVDSSHDVSVKKKLSFAPVFDESSIERVPSATAACFKLFVNLVRVSIQKQFLLIQEFTVASTCVCTKCRKSWRTKRNWTTYLKTIEIYNLKCNFFEIIIVRMRLLPTLLAALVCCQLTNSLRILGVFPLNGKSHWVMADSLMTSLAKRGHHVDVITHFPRKKPMPNYTDISLQGTLEPVMNNLNASIKGQLNNINMHNLVHKAGSITCELLSQPQIQQLIKNPPKDPPYDLVILELFLAPCYLGFGRHLNVPMIGVITCNFHDWLYSKVGSPLNTAYMPSLFSSYEPRMTFWQRLHNTILTTFITTQINYYTEQQHKVMKDNFGIEATFDELHKDLAAILINSHHSINGIKPLTPGLIEVGGLHVSEESDPLSPELKKWLDESTDGCILFTFGSMMRIETFPKPLLQTFYRVFEKIAPVRVLMKVAKKEDLVPGLPKNVMIQSWFPQVAVFKHKNTKGFITHGGLMSTIEAIYFGIPMIGIPLFGDQPANVKVAANKKITVSLGSVENVTDETLGYAINQILYDDTYRTNIKKLSALYKERPMSPIDTAIYWIEYVAKYGNILQSPAVHLNWWQLNLLDVYGFILACVAIVLYAVIFVLRKLKNRLLSCKSCPKKGGKSSDSKKNK